MGYVYVFRAEHKYKVGQTLDLARRFNEIKSYEPNLEFCFAAHVPNHSVIERTIHQVFWHKRQWPTEWFTLSNIDLFEIKLYLNSICG